MSSFSIIILLGLIALSTATFKHSDSDITYSDPDLKELAFRVAIEEAVLSLPKSRARRAAQRNCGSKLIVFIISVCGEPCTPQEGGDIATQCCGEACDADYIKTSCCPNK